MGKTIMNILSENFGFRRARNWSTQQRQYFKTIWWMTAGERDNNKCNNIFKKCWILDFNMVPVRRGDIWWFAASMLLELSASMTFSERERHRLVCLKCKPPPLTHLPNPKKSPFIHLFVKKKKKINCYNNYYNKPCKIIFIIYFAASLHLDLVVIWTGNMQSLESM